jgi:osmotically-inducible protein OsmY
VNVRASAEQALLAGDEGATEADRDITQQIRTRLTEDTALSATAGNVKIVTADRKVKLLGSVSTETEKTSIATLARSIAGEGNVDDQLAVKPYP